MPEQANLLESLTWYLEHAGPGTGLLGLKCLELCCQRPRTIAELEAELQENNGSICRAVLTLTPYFHRPSQSVKLPALHLLQRRKRPRPERGHRIHCTTAGKRFAKTLITF